MKREEQVNELCKAKPFSDLAKDHLQAVMQKVWTGINVKLSKMVIRHLLDGAIACEYQFPRHFLSSCIVKISDGCENIEH